MSPQRDSPHLLGVKFDIYSIEYLNINKTKMKNRVFTRLYCSDPKELSKIIGSLSFKDSEIDTSVLEETEGVDVRSYNDAPYEEIRALSKSNPNITFTACYTFKFRK